MSEPTYRYIVLATFEVVASSEHEAYNAIRQRLSFGKRVDNINLADMEVTDVVLLNDGQTDD